MDSFELSTLISAVQGTAHGVGSFDPKFNQSQIDTRQLNAGDIFWAIPGEQQDGHNFVDEAFHQRAAAAVINNSQSPSRFGPTVSVDNTVDALAAWAKHHHHQNDALTIGITGSVGKTTTRELLYSVLSQKHYGTRSPHNYNNHLGVPLSLLQVDKDHEFAVLEFGASHRGEIEYLTKIAEPEIGIITAIGPAHISEFGSLDKIIESKTELIANLPKSGISVLAGDDPNLQTVSKVITNHTILVGQKSHNNIQATDVRIENEQLSFVVQNETYRLNVQGKHFLTSALCSIAVARELGLTSAEIKAGLAGFKPLQGRGDSVRVGPWTVINDSYNANPTSMLAASELLESWNTNRQRIFICGDMLELGDKSARYHYEAGQQIGKAGFDGLISLGRFAPDMTAGAIDSGMSSYQVADCDNKQTLLAILHCWLEPEAVLLLKGSRSMRMETIIDDLQRIADQPHFDRHISQQLPAVA